MKEENKSGNTKDIGFKEQFIKRYYTAKGINMLEGYLKNMVHTYCGDNTYPIKLGMILGVPTFGYINKIETREHLLERIKMIAQIIAVDFIYVDGKNILKMEDN